jgi:PDZ-binding kinase
MEYGGEKSLNDLIEERNKDSGSPFPAAVILRVALHMARGLKVTVSLYFKQLG